MSYQQLALFIIEQIGGVGNIITVSHCATRLRFTLHDEHLAETAVLEKQHGIISIVQTGGQYQIVIGPHVNQLYEEVERAIKSDLNTTIPLPDDDSGKGNVVGRLFTTISGIFSPLLPAFAGSGILRGLILLSVQMGILKENSGTYTILTVAAMSVFYFLPIELAITSAKKFHVSPYIALLIGASLLNPDFISLMGDKGNGAMTSFLGVPVVLMNYAATVIPIIFAIWLYGYLEKALHRYIPEGMQLVFVPLISLVIMVPLTVVVIGPLGVYGGEMIASLINQLIQSNGLIAGAVVGGGWNLLVVLGLHWAVNPIMINNISTLGYDLIVPLTFATNFAMAGATFGVFLKTKNKKLKAYSLSSILTIGFAGITEPAIYGVAVKLKKPFIAAVIGGAIGGAFMGVMQVSSNAFVFGGLTTLPAFVGGHFMAAIIGLSICFVLSAGISYLMGFEDPVDTF